MKIQPIRTHHDGNHFGSCTQTGLLQDNGRRREVVLCSPKDVRGSVADANWGEGKFSAKAASSSNEGRSFSNSPLYRLNQLTPPTGEYERFPCGIKRSAPFRYEQLVGTLLGFVVLGLIGYLLVEVSK